LRGDTLGQLAGCLGRDDRHDGAELGTGPAPAVRRQCPEPSGRGFTGRSEIWRRLDE